MLQQQQQLEALRGEQEKVQRMIQRQREAHRAGLWSVLLLSYSLLCHHTRVKSMKHGINISSTSMPVTIYLMELHCTYVYEYDEERHQ